MLLIAVKNRNFFCISNAALFCRIIPYIIITFAFTSKTICEEPRFHRHSEITAPPRNACHIQNTRAGSRAVHARHVTAHPCAPSPNQHRMAQSAQTKRPCIWAHASPGFSSQHHGAEPCRLAHPRCREASESSVKLLQPHGMGLCCQPHSAACSSAPGSTRGGGNFYSVVAKPRAWAGGARPTAPPLVELLVNNPNLNSLAGVCYAHGAENIYI